MTTNVATISGLNIGFSLNDQVLPVVRGIDLNLRRGQILGLIGESGSGKTVVGLSMLGLLPNNAVASASAYVVSGNRILHMRESALRRIRGTEISMIFQDPGSALNPARKISWHLKHAYKQHRRDRNRDDWKTRARQALSDLRINDIDKVMELYPHQLSGGMLQRILIGMALLLNPKVVVADEPTTNLDKLVEAQILLLMRQIRDRAKAGILFITHDMGVASVLCDRIAVMYAGTIVEEGYAADILSDPKHPYTAGLVATARSLRDGDSTLQEIPGSLPSLREAPRGCLFAPRCTAKRADCISVRPSVSSLSNERRVACKLYG